MSPAVYIQKVKANEIHDPVLSFQLANDFLYQEDSEELYSRRHRIRVLRGHDGVEQYLL
jgi:hypothetical protein